MSPGKKAMVIGGAGLLLLLLFYKRDDGGSVGSDIVNTVRSLRNNNPLNIENDGTQWQGMTGTDGPYIIFDTMVNGLRAGARNLINQQKLHGLNTISAIITKFAPPSDNNPTDAYIAKVSRDTGIAPNAPIDLNDDETLLAMMKSMASDEGGAAASILPDSLFQQGIDAARA